MTCHIAMASLTSVRESRVFNQPVALTSGFPNLGHKYTFTLKAAEMIQGIPALYLCVKLKLTRSLWNRA